MSRRLLIVAVAFTLLAIAGPAWAHVAAPPLHSDAHVSDAPVVTQPAPEMLLVPIAPTSPRPWLLAAGAAVVLALTLRRRGAIALALLVLLTCGLFEAGMHSVHHLTEADAAKCSVAAVSSHAGGIVVASIAVERPADIATDAVPCHVAAFAPSRLAAPDRGRAPPAA